MRPIVFAFLFALSFEGAIHATSDDCGVHSLVWSRPGPVSASATGQRNELVEAVRGATMTPAEYIERLRSQVGLGEYQLGAGGWDHKNPLTCFHPHWRTGKVGCDCSAYAVKFGLKLRGHRPGFGRGPGARVTDDINSDSVLYDAIHNHELFELVEGPPIEGDLIITPSRFNSSGERVGIGHVRATTGNRALEWDHKVLPRPWGLVDVLECRGPNGKKPGVIEGTAAACAKHDAKWVKVPAMWTQVVRVRAEVLAAIEI